MPAPRKFTHEQLQAAALELIDQEGLAGLTMRALASRLGTGPMTTLSGTQIGFWAGVWRVVLVMLYLTAGLYALFIALCVMGLRQWQASLGAFHPNFEAAIACNRTPRPWRTAAPRCCARTCRDACSNWRRTASAMSGASRTARSPTCGAS